MTMNYKQLKTFFETKETFEKELDTYITIFLTNLQNKELEILNEHSNDLIKHGASYAHYYFRVSFMPNYFYIDEEKENNENNEIKCKYQLESKQEEHKFISYDEKGITVQLCGTPVTIPYQYNDKTLENYYSIFFDTLRKDIQKIIVKINKDKEFSAKCKKKDKDIRQEHKYNEYVYWWSECPTCYHKYNESDNPKGYSTGKLTRGTGKYVDSNYHDGTDEVTETYTCPKCEGEAGLLHYYKIDRYGYKGHEKTKPCHKYTFESDENDFMNLIT